MSKLNLKFPLSNKTSEITFKCLTLPDTPSMVLSCTLQTKPPICAILREVCSHIAILREVGSRERCALISHATESREREREEERENA